MMHRNIQEWSGVLSENALVMLSKAIHDGGLGFGSPPHAFPTVFTLGAYELVSFCTLSAYDLRLFPFGEKTLRTVGADLLFSLRTTSGFKRCFRILNFDV